MGQVEKIKPCRSMRIILPLVLLFFTLLLLLIGSVLLSVKDVNDGWILEDVWPYFFSLSLVYALTVSYSSNLKLIAVITAVYLVAINVIPNLKYVFVYGYHDPLLHYGSIKQTVDAGHIVEAGVYQEQYATTPGMHIFVSVLSIVTCLDPLGAYKLFLIILPVMLPFAVYAGARRLNMPNSMARVTLISTAITAPLTYIYTGTVSVYPLYVLFIYSSILLFAYGLTKRAHMIIFILLWVIILTSHDATSFFLSTYLLSYAVFVSLKDTTQRVTSRRTSTVLILLLAISALGHFILSGSISNLLKIFSLAGELLSKLISGGLPIATSGYYDSFTCFSLVDKVKIVFVRFGRDGISMALIFLAPIVLWRSHLYNNRLRRFYRTMLFPLIFAFVVFLLFLFLRPVETRGLIYITALSPFLAGATFYSLFHSRNYSFKRPALTVTLFSLICVSSLTTYSFQPLIPTSPLSPGIYPAFDMRQVNTVYDRSMISFIDSHNLRLNVWADVITASQILALTDLSFQSLLVHHRTQARLLLVSSSGPSHAIPSGRDAYLNDEYLRGALLNNSVLYDNGLSYVLANQDATIVP